MSTFADSSALVKLYADETGHEQVRGTGSIVVSQLARVDVPAALWRKQRVGELSANDARLLTADFEADYFGTDSEPHGSLPSRPPGASSTRLRGCAHRMVFELMTRSKLSSALAVRRVDGDCA